MFIALDQDVKIGKTLPRGINLITFSLIGLKMSSVCIQKIWAAGD